MFSLGVALHRYLSHRNPFNSYTGHDFDANHESDLNLIYLTLSCTNREVNADKGSILGLETKEIRLEIVIKKNKMLFHKEPN